jgi:hypothetical protein
MGGANGRGSGAREKTTIKTLKFFSQNQIVRFVQSKAHIYGIL